MARLLSIAMQVRKLSTQFLSSFIITSMSFVLLVLPVFSSRSGVGADVLQSGQQASRGLPSPSTTSMIQLPSHTGAIQLHKRFYPSSHGCPKDIVNEYRLFTGFWKWVGRFCNACSQPQPTPDWFELCWRPHHYPSQSSPVEQSWEAAAAAGLPIDCVHWWVEEEGFMSTQYLPAKTGDPAQPHSSCPLGYSCMQWRDQQKDTRITCSPNNASPRRRKGSLIPGHEQISRKVWNDLMGNGDFSDSDSSFDPSVHDRERSEWGSSSYSDPDPDPDPGSGSDAIDVAMDFWSTRTDLIKAAHKHEVPSHNWQAGIKVP